MKYICCLILFFTVLLPSCQWGRQEAFFPDEGLAERLLRENPDSLAMILEEQVIPSELSDSLGRNMAGGSPGCINDRDGIW
ncbi:hypothetical protein [Parabacteroides sp. AM58-2XD]|uniref:hypothetical protein n=1 Tax=Parabacteroides sp. AM58-2XD TaxID=2292362 RepID=UPI001F414307|nr:hypothetical protein [Parabacteroides sp. AM58-2XD]